MKALLLAEKPSLMRDLKSAYDKMSFADHIDFMALRGHILENFMPEEYDVSWGRPWRAEVLPLIPEVTKYKVTASCADLHRQIVKTLKDNEYDYIINACDAGREGELIFHSLYRHLNLKVPVKRLWASDTTEGTLQNALKNLLPDADFENLQASARFRSDFDWLIGMNMSRAVTLRSGSLVPLGRVMTPTLAIIVKRELEVTSFEPKDFFEIVVNFASKYPGKWFDPDEPEEDQSRILDKSKAEAILARIPETGTVESFEQSQEKNQAPTLHSLLELQKEANRTYGYPADQTLALAQSLYEKYKLISYPRTESRYLPTSMIPEIPKHLKSLAAIPELQEAVQGILASPAAIAAATKGKRYVDDKKITDHHALLPTQTRPNLAALPAEEKNIYLLVARRFVAIFMPACLSLKTKIITRAGQDLFITRHKAITNPGYQALYGKTVQREISDIKQGDIYEVVDKKLESKQTTPPKRYDDASLLQAMQNAGKYLDDEALKNILKESAGLGTSATRAEIIKKLVARKMVERKGKLFYACEFGISIIGALSEHEICSPSLTAEWEQKLQLVETGALAPLSFRSEMVSYVTTATQGLLAVRMKIQGAPDKPGSAATIIGTCPLCGGDIRVTKVGWSCSNYRNEPPCKFMIWGTVAGKKLTGKNALELLKKGATGTIKGFKSKAGKPFAASLQMKEDKTGVVFVFKRDDENGSSGPSVKAGP